MSDRARRLHETLVELHAQLEESGELDPQLREELRASAGQIQAALDEAPEGEGGNLESGLIERLRTAVRRFEGSHPKLTAATGRVIDALSEMGI